MGKLKRGFIRDGCRHYADRIESTSRIELVEVKEGKSASNEETRRTEGAHLLAARSGWVVALDERGSELSSRELAARIDYLELKGHSSLTILIGGAEGLSDEVRSAANEIWSLSRLTLPHELARLVLLEQIYRAQTIRSGHPYHRD